MSEVPLNSPSPKTEGLNTLSAGESLSRYKLVVTKHWKLHEVTASERRGNDFTSFKDFCLKAKAITWSGLS